jgi:MFS family permease
MTGVLLLSNIAVHNAAGLIVTTAFFGLFSGMFVATPVLLLIALTKDKRKMGTRMGMAFAMMGLGVLSGGPGSGGVLQRDSERLDWNGTWAYGGVFAVAAGLVFCVLRVWLGGWKLRVKV